MATNGLNLVRLCPSWGRAFHKALEGKEDDENLTLSLCAPVCVCLSVCLASQQFSLGSIFLYYLGYDLMSILLPHSVTDTHTHMCIHKWHCLASCFFFFSVHSFVPRLDVRRMPQAKEMK